MLAGLVIACVQPPSSDQKDLPSREAAPPDTRASTADPVSKKPECDIDTKNASLTEGETSESALTEPERRNVFREVLDLRERALREAQKAFPTPQAQSIGGPGHLTKELAVESARRGQAESLERYYLGQFVLGRQLSCDEVGRIFREGLEKGWTQP
jgi:hypothetical protein